MREEIIVVNPIGQATVVRASVGRMVLCFLRAHERVLARAAVLILTMVLCAMWSSRREYFHEEEARRAKLTEELSQTRSEAVSLKSALGASSIELETLRDRVRSLEQDLSEARTAKAMKEQQDQEPGRKLISVSEGTERPRRASPSKSTVTRASGGSRATVWNPTRLPTAVDLHTPVVLPPGIDETLNGVAGAGGGPPLVFPPTHPRSPSSIPISIPGRQPVQLGRRAGLPGHVGGRSSRRNPGGVGARSLRRGRR